MGDPVTDFIIQAAEEMRAHGHVGQLIAVVGDSIELNGLRGVSTSSGEVLVHQHIDLAAPYTIQVVTEATYQRMLEER